MAVVGEASIIVRAITNKVKKDVEKAFKDLKPVIEKAGEDLGKDFSKSFSKNVNVSNVGDQIGAQIHEGVEEGAQQAGKVIQENLKRSSARAGEESGNVFSERFGKFIEGKFADEAIKASEAFTKVFAVGNIAGVGISGLVGSLSAVVSGLFAMGSAAAQAAPALAVLPGLYSSIAVGAASVKVAFSGFGKELSKGFAGAIKGGKDASSSMKKLEESLKGMPAETKKFARSVIDLAGPFKTLRNAVQQDFFSGLNRNFSEIGTRVMPVLTTNLRVAGAVMGNFGDQIIRTITSGQGLKLLNGFLTGSVRTLGIFATKGFEGKTAIESITLVIGRLLNAIQPLTQRFAGWLSGLAQSAELSTRGVSGMTKLTNTFNQAGDTAAQLGRIFGNLFGVIMDLGRSAAPAGKSLLDSFEAVTEKLRGIIQFNTASGTLNAYFTSVADNMRAIGNLINVIGREFLGLGANKGIADLANNLIPAVEGVGKLAEQMLGAGGAFGEFISHLSEIAQILGDSVGFELFFSVLNSILAGFQAIISTPLGGWFVGIIGVIAAVTRSLSFAKSAAQFFIKVLVGGPIKAVRDLKLLETQITRTGRAAKVAGSGGVAALGTQLDNTLKTAGGSTVVMGGVGNAVTKAGDVAEKSTTKWGKLGDKFKSMRPGIAGLVGTAGMLGLSAAMDSTSGSADHLNSTLSGAALGFTVGGPWGAAVGGAIGLGLSFVKRSDEMSAALRRQADEARKDAEAIRVITGNLGGFRDALGSTFRNSPDGFKATAASTAAVRAELTKLENATDAAGNKVNAGLIPALQSLAGNVSTRELFAGIAEGGPVLTTLQNNIKELGSASDLEVTRLQKMRDAVKELGGNAENVSGLMAELSRNQEALEFAKQNPELGDSGNIAALQERIDTIKLAIAANDEYGDHVKEGIQVDLEKARVERERIAELGRVAGLTREAALAERNKMLTARQAKIEEQGSQSVYAKTLEQLRQRAIQLSGGERDRVDKIITQFESRNYPKTVAQIFDFGRKVKATPDEMKVFFRTVGVKPTLNDVAKIAKTRGIKNIKVVLTKLGFKGTPEEIAKVEGKVKNLNKQEAKPKVKPKIDLPGLLGIKRSINSIKAKDVRVGAFLAPGARGNIVQALNSIVANATVNVTVRTNGPGRASGGQVLAGRTYRVGEIGEELFVPQTDGRIIPNWQLKSMDARTTSQRAGAVSNINNIVVNNPAPERASVSTTRSLRERVSNAGWGY